MRAKTLVLLGVLICLVTGLAFGDDVDPAPWRGREGTNLVSWDFSTASPNPSPAKYNGLTTGISATVSGAWKDMVDGRGGVWDLSGGMLDVVVPGPTKLYKDGIMGVQVTWMARGGGVPTMTMLRPACPVAAVSMMNTKPVGGGWMVTTLVAHWNPEKVVDQFEAAIKGNVLVDGVVLETLDYDDPGNPTPPTR